MFACDKSLISSCLSSDNIKSNANIQSGFQDLEHLVKTVQRNVFNGGPQRNSIKAQNLKSKGILSLQTNKYDRLDTLSSLGNSIPLTPSNSSELKSQIDLTFKKASYKPSVSSPIRHDPSFNRSKNNQRLFEIEKLLSPRKIFADKSNVFGGNPNSFKVGYNTNQNFGQASVSPSNNKLKKRIESIISEQASKPKIAAFTHKYEKKSSIKLYRPQSPSPRVNTDNFYSPIRFTSSSKFGLLELAQKPKDTEFRSTNLINIYDKYLDRDSVCKFKDEFKYDQQQSLFTRTFSGIGK